MNTSFNTHIVAITLVGLSALGCAGESDIFDDVESMGEIAMNGDDGDDDDDGGEDGQPERADGGGGEDEGGLELEPCVAVDLLFVVDNSDTMAEEQAKLLAGAGAFISDSAALLPADIDFHIGVVTTDSADLVRHDLQGVDCNFFSEQGLPFMTHAGAMNTSLDTGLGCAAVVGVAGSPDERPIEMALSALGPGANLPEGANPGFVRDDAVLVLVLLTDEEDDHETVTGWGSAGEPQDWSDELIELVGGVEERAVVLSLVGHDKPNACPGFQWDGKEGAELAPRLVEFTQGFTHGVVGDVCASSYADFFAQAAVEVAGACGVAG